MFRILVMGLTGPLANQLFNRLQGHATVVVCRSPDELRHQLDHLGSDLFIVDDTAVGKEVYELIQSNRAATAGSPPIPVIAILDGDPAASAAFVHEENLDSLLFHPVDPAELVATAREHLAPPELEFQDAATQLTHGISQIWERMQDRVFAQVDAVEEAVVALIDDRLDNLTQAGAAGEAHKLAGSLGTFGFDRGTDLARELELALKADLVQTDALRLSQLVLDLRDTLLAPPAGPEPSPATGAPADVALLILESDDDTARELLAEAASRGLPAKIESSYESAVATVTSARPRAIVLDMSFGVGPAGAVPFLEQMASAPDPIPVVVTVGGDALGYRADVARLGGRVMVVDDDPNVLAAIESLLVDERFTVITQPDSLKFWETMLDYKPDLLILDVDMPGLTGVEICRLVRLDAEWTDIPILFLTAHSDARTVRQVFAAGADDFVAKPFVGPELIGRVQLRLSRRRYAATAPGVDQLTGAATRPRFLEELRELIARSLQREIPLALGDVELDDIARLNDEHGYPGGDLVLSRLGEMLIDAFRGDDVVARWDGDEFMVAMPGMSRDDAAHRLAIVLDDFRSQRFDTGDGSSFSATFSVGVASSTEDGTAAEDLLTAAETARRQARSPGGDRIVMAGHQPESRDDAERVDVMLVDDDEVLAELLLGALRTRGYRTAWVSHGADARDVLLAGQSPIGVVLLDLNMPGIDGMSLLREMNRAGLLKTTRVLMLTASSTEAIERTALELGAADFVAKPFSVPVLMNRIRQLLEGPSA